MDRHGIETFAELLHRADEDIEWFWDAAIKDIDIAFYRDYDKVVDLSQGKQWAKWWIGGRGEKAHRRPDRPRPRGPAGQPARPCGGEAGARRPGGGWGRGTPAG